MAPTLTVVLATPAGDPLMGKLVSSIARENLEVVVVELDPSRTGDASHEASFRAALQNVHGTVVLGGFSLGARTAAHVCPTVSAEGLLCLGYPFHRAKDPSDRHGLEALKRVRVPACIIQGARDNHGTESEVSGYLLSDDVELVWVPDGNHRFVPRERSSATEESNVDMAFAAASDFLRRMTVK